MTSNRRKPLIAIVDDDVTVCRAIKRFVWTHGIKAETFVSGRDFIEVLDAMPSFVPQCAILDMHMPGLDGFQVQMRLACIRPHVPVIFLTSAHDPRLYKQALALGAVAFFQKPLHDDLDELIKTLYAVLKMWRPRLL
jgi:FixJ family two-component response regulator